MFDAVPGQVARANRLRRIHQQVRGAVGLVRAQPCLGLDRVDVVERCANEVFGAIAVSIGVRDKKRRVVVVQNASRPDKW